MKRIPAFIAAGLILFSFSCNNSGKENNEKVTADTTTTAITTATVVSPPVFTPFKIMIVQHQVKNFDKWKVGYLAHDSIRLAYGISKFVMGRELDDSNKVIVIDKMNDLQKAKQFATLPNLKEAMQRAGVSGPPTFSYVDVIRNDDTHIDQKDRMMVVHHVKNFDAWLKVYDSEGKATRMANGMLDRGMGRGAEDSNMVYLVFAITDMAKAKARVHSPELKKIMTDAGVDGAPKVFFYRLVD